MKPKIIEHIEQLWGEDFALHPAPAYPDLLGGLMPCKKNHPKYALDEQGQLIGLNLAATKLDDGRWQEIVVLLEKHAVQLQALNLCENQLKNFVPPPSIDRLTALDIEDNPLEFPPPEITKQGSDAVLRFLQDATAQGTRESFEVKMLIVGEGEAGKTTLWNLLQDPNYSVDEKRKNPTVGIQIKEGWEFAHLDRQNTTFLVNLWDFGGQEIQYMTHQFFLTRRSFYVLLANGRSESPNFPYWLNIINVLGRTPEEKLPILVVINEKGNRNPAPPYDAAEVKKQYPHLELIRMEVDFKEKGKRLEALHEEIKQILCRQIAHLPVVIPTSWDNVQTEIKVLQKSANHINHAQFVKICIKHGIVEQQKQDDLSLFLHDLGFILHFHELTLKNFVVLNPNWAVNAVYAVLENQDVKNFNQGRFNKKVLQDIWTEKGFSEEEQGNLISLMLKDGLEICFKAADSNGEEIFIAPQLLQEKAPANTAWQDNGETLRYVYDYNFMPKGIITRLIVRLHEDIEGCGDGDDCCPDYRKLVWKKGAYLRKGGCRAQVRLISDWQHQRERIKIEVQGGRTEDRKHVLWGIREELNRIHRNSFSSLRVAEKIPCCCERCKSSDDPSEYDYQELEERKKNEVETVQCGKNKYQDVSIQQLLDGVFQERGYAVEEKEKSEQASVIIHNHLSSDTDNPAPKTWWKRWWAWVLAAVGFIGSIASIIGFFY
ncbi:MAG: hypothetical protein D3923_04730 [Candidatus Electrothrix sp. AR3]|nr:hypothetical protein [Candidatus Electrothrix sp. AR3]